MTKESCAPGIRKVIDVISCGSCEFYRHDVNVVYSTERMKMFGIVNRKTTRISMFVEWKNRWLSYKNCFLMFVYSKCHSVWQLLEEMPSKLPN